MPQTKGFPVTNIAKPASIRPARPEDVPALAAMMVGYMREAFDDDWHGSAEALSRDGFGREFEMHVASSNADLVGLVAWRKAYDLHHCTSGAEVIDMFVVPAFRGRGIGPAMVCSVAAEVIQRGGKFLKGQAVEDRSVRRLYERAAVTFVAVECMLSGRALRTLAGLAHASPRTLARSLPQSSWNYEA